MAGHGSFIESFPLFGYDLGDYDELFSEKLELLLMLRECEHVTSSGKHRAPLEDAGFAGMLQVIEVSGYGQESVACLLVGAPRRGVSGISSRLDHRYFHPGVFLPPESIGFHRMYLRIHTSEDGGSYGYTTRARLSTPITGPEVVRRRGEQAVAYLEVMPEVVDAPVAR